MLRVRLSCGDNVGLDENGMELKTGLSERRAERITARTFVDNAMRHTEARRKCPDFRALQNVSCGGKEVYLAPTEEFGFALPFLNCSNGNSRHRRRFRITHIGSSKVAKRVGAKFSVIERTIALFDGSVIPDKEFSM